MTVANFTVEEFDAFVTGWGPIVRNAAGAEIVEAIAAGQRETENWTDEQRFNWIWNGIAP
jgi:hypothetical protein